MSRSTNPLFLPTVANDLSKLSKARRTLTPNEWNDVKFFLDGAKRSSMASTETSVRGRRILVPVTSKALFDGTLEPSMKSNEEQFVLHVGNGKFEDMSREQARKLVDLHCSGSTDVGSESKPSKTTTKSPLKHELNRVEELTKTKNTSNSIATTNNKPSLPLDAPSDDGLPLMEIREEWDEYNKDLVRSEVVNISKQMEQLNAGLKQKGDDCNGKQFGKLLVDLLERGDGEIQSGNLHDSSLDVAIDPSKSTSEIRTDATSKVSDEEYKAIYSRLEELEKLEEEQVSNTKKHGNDQNISRTNSKSKGWSKGFLNTKPKSKVSQKQQQINPKQQKVISLVNDVKVPMKRPTTISAEVDAKTTRVSFSKDVNVKEITPRAADLTQNEQNYFEEPQEVNPFLPVETVPFEENVFKGVVKEREPYQSTSEKVKEPSGEKKLSRFALQRLERGL